MDTFLDEHLALLRDRTSMFVFNFKEPFSGLVDHLFGYSAALNVRKLEGAFPSDAFTEWLLRVKKAKGLAGYGNIGWNGMISLTYPDERARLDAFFALYDEFRAARGRRKRASS